MSFNIEAELSRIDGRLREIEPLLLSSKRRAFENRKRSYPQDQVSSGFDRNVNATAEKDAHLSDEEHEPPVKKIVDSVVVTPVSVSTSREKRIQELEKGTDSKDKARNRRFFSNILGTLGNSRQRDSVAVKQSKKLEEIEEKLAAMKKAEQSKILEEKENRIHQEKDAHSELLILQRNKAILQYAANKISHYELLKNSIQTKTKPSCPIQYCPFHVIFFLPAKHNVRSLELLNASRASIDKLIETRKTVLNEELVRNRSKMDRFTRPNQDATTFLRTSVQIESSPSRSDRSRSRSFSRSVSEESLVLPSEGSVQIEAIDDPAETVIESDPTIESSDSK